VRAVALLALLFAPSAAGAGTFEASGYLKTLYRRSRSPLSLDRYWSDLSRARVQLDLRRPVGDGSGGLAGPASSVRAHVEYDHELLVGSYLDSLDYRLFGLNEPETFLKTEQDISTGTDGHYRHRLYRGWIELRSGPWRVRFGRQRIAWGTGKLWNPTDFLNPYSPVKLEREERPGTDAATVRRGLGVLGRAEAVYTLSRGWAASDLLGRLRGNLRGTDLSVLGGKVAGSTSSWTVGGDFSADLHGGNLHGEWLYMDLRGPAPFWRFMAGYEYTFSAEPPVSLLKDLWFVAEYFHNGRGRTDSPRYDRGMLRGGREIALGRDFIGFGLRRELHPLLEVEVYHIRSLTDGSDFLQPAVEWNCLSNLHLSAGFQRFGGSPSKEFGWARNTVFLQTLYYF